MGILFAIIASVAYGTSDFFGGLAARRWGAITATTAVYAAATVVAVASMAFLPWQVSTAAVVAGLLAGIFAIAGFITFYAALAIGPMSVLSPSIALVNTAVPVVAALVLGASLSSLGWLGVALAVGAGVLVSAEPRGGKRVDPRGLVLAVISGLLLGAAIVALDFAPESSGVLPAVLDTTVGLVLIAPLALLLRGTKAPAWLRRFNIADGSASPALDGSVASGRGRIVLLAVVGGLLLGASNVLIVLALHGGSLAVVSVLVNLYPVVTVILAAVVLRERLAALQIAGVVLALVAAVLLTLS